MSLELVLLLASSLVLQQHPARAELRDVAESVASTNAIVFAGSVVGPEGPPAAGVVVVSSAGGEAVTDADGGFALAVELPLDAQTVELTATLDRGARGSFAASVRVAPASLAPTTRVGRLVLLPVASCQPSWRATFDGRSGLNSLVRAFVEFDDGNGSALYAGGAFTTAGGVEAEYIAKRVGHGWESVAGGPDGPVHALEVHDDGSGPALYAGGAFATAGGVTVNGIAKWDGASWSALDGGVTGSVGFAGPVVYALAVHDDGTGPALYAGGNFLVAGGVPAPRIARWDGASWTALGNGTGIGGNGASGGSDARVYALAAFDDGTGFALYVGGDFTTVDEASANGIARWDGASFGTLSSGLSGTVGAEVRTMAVHDDGDGADLYVGGRFIEAGGVSARGTARWDGTSWSALANLNPPRVHVLEVLDDGGGPALYAGGEFVSAGALTLNGVARWNGSSWGALGGGLGSESVVRALAMLHHGNGSTLYAGGEFDTVEGVTLSHVAQWDGASWAPVERGFDDGVESLAVFDDGDGSALHAGGAFTNASGAEIHHIARWNGSEWEPLAAGLEPIGPFVVHVYALRTFDPGNGVGPGLYAGGIFSLAGGNPADNIARWDGTSWSPLGSGVDLIVEALAVFDDGSGPALFVAGRFGSAGGAPANNIARWSGASWSPLGSGISGPGPHVYALAVFDDGGGPALFVGGFFSAAGGVPANNIARWDGTSWSVLGSGLDSSVASLAVFDDGAGPALYAAGRFTHAGGVPANRIARWDGSTWSALGDGITGELVFAPIVPALAVHDDGGGAALYAAGGFTTAGGQAVNGIARWDGSTWSALGSGLLGIETLASYAGDDGAALVAGGTFAAGPKGDSFLARWTCARKVRPED